MKYMSLENFKRNSNGNLEKVETEYKNRIDNYASINTTLFPNLMYKGEYKTSEFPIYFMNLPKISVKIEQINNNSKNISSLAKKLTEIAKRQYFFETLRNEIKSTNDIEGVRSTKKEIDHAIKNVDSDSNDVRLKSTVKMYLDVFDGKELPITDVQDILNIYHNLLENEIKKENKLDGEYFRNSPVYIQGGNVDRKVHVAPLNEREILKRIKEWISFVNDDEVPFLIKAMIGHFFFENTHPFYDGNGRTGRYILSMYLSRKLDEFTGISFSQIVQTNKSTYYKAFEEAGAFENRAELTFFVDKMLKLVIKSQNLIIDSLTFRIDKFNGSIKKINKHYGDNSPESYILFLLAQSKMFNDSDDVGLLDKTILSLAKTSPFSVRKIKDTIEKLENEKRLIKIKSNPKQHIISDIFL
ncbi:Fic family protein [Fructilactobacillus frigidiflavus]|uniref:Fic family protein n=1 Tax=Fructilactobacillus frigidiflavus TaxID=3242688 RepID=UPI003756F570